MTKTTDRLLAVLGRYWGHASFRPGQREIVELVLAGNNVLGLLSTGGGKSVTYQLPALLLPGITLVVSPLISLMIDQVQQLRAKGHGYAAYLNSALPAAEVSRLLSEVAEGRYKLLYVSPEKLRQPGIVRLLNRRGVSLVAIDEAHCISQWGHDFRTDYLRLPQAVEALGSPPVLAVTATATREVREEICRLFRIRPEHVVAQPLNRANIAYDVVPVASEAEKRERMLDALSRLGGPGIVYCGTRQAVEDLVDFCRDAGLARRIHGYHGGMSSFERVLIQEQFLKGELDVIVATNAFGMGIDKADIRYVLHYHFPASLEAYIQEVGRIGRDGRPGYACLYYLPDDVHLHVHLLENEIPAEADIRLFAETADRLARESGTISLQTAASTLGLDETPLRLLFFYAEQAGLLTPEAEGDTRRFLRGAAPLEQAVRTIGEALQHTRTQKQAKLAHMRSWLEQSDCLRRGLSRYFGDGGEADYDLYCCTRCGLERSAFEAAGEAAPHGERAWSLDEALSALLPDAGRMGRGGRER